MYPRCFNRVCLNRLLNRLKLQFATNAPGRVSCLLPRLRVLTVAALYLLRLSPLTLREPEAAGTPAKAPINPLPKKLNRTKIPTLDPFTPLDEEVGALLGVPHSCAAPLLRMRFLPPRM